MVTIFLFRGDFLIARHAMTIEKVTIPASRINADDQEREALFRAERNNRTWVDEARNDRSTFFSSLPTLS